MEEVIDKDITLSPLPSNGISDPTSTGNGNSSSQQKKLSSDSSKKAM